jgi:hypothetical protein
MKIYEGVHVQDEVFLISELVGEWPASHPDRFDPRKRASSTHCIGG